MDKPQSCNCNCCARWEDAYDQAIEALELALYYVNGDATYESLIQKIKDKFGIEIK